MLQWFQIFERLQKICLATLYPGIWKKFWSCGHDFFWMSPYNRSLSSAGNEANRVACNLQKHFWQCKVQIKEKPRWLRRQQLICARQLRYGKFTRGRTVQTKKSRDITFPNRFKTLSWCSSRGVDVWPVSTEFRELPTFLVPNQFRELPTRSDSSFLRLPSDWPTSNPRKLSCVSELTSLLSEAGCERIFSKNGFIHNDLIRNRLGHELMVALLRNTMNAEHFDGIMNDQFLWDDNGGGYGDIADIYNMIREDANDQ